METLLRYASLYCTAAKSRGVKSWIKRHVKDPDNHCFFYAAVISLLFPEYKGKPIRKGDTAHFFLRDKDGHILDPTYEGPADYDGAKPVSAKKNLKSIIKDPLFKLLPKEDREKIECL